MKARIVIGANYGDEGKGTIVAKYARDSRNVLNVLTNGGSQRGHSILTDDGSITYQHFGSGTYYGADSYYSRFFILNPVHFAREHKTLIVKPKCIFRDKDCRWTTIYDMMANHIQEELKKRHASCCAGIWNTVKRYHELPYLTFDQFTTCSARKRLVYLSRIRKYYERNMTIPPDWTELWNSPFILAHFLEDCMYMARHTITADLEDLRYDNLIFENGQGLLLCDTGEDTYDTTPSNTGIADSLRLLEGLDAEEVTAHYVSRTYLTRHGDGPLINEANRTSISSGVNEDRTNHYNEGQGKFRYGILDIENLHERVIKDAGGVSFKLELTHCDELDNVNDVKRVFGSDIVNVCDSPLV